MLKRELTIYHKIVLRRGDVVLFTSAEVDWLATRNLSHKT